MTRKKPGRCECRLTNSLWERPLHVHLTWWHVRWDDAVFSLLSRP